MVAGATVAVTFTEGLNECMYMYPNLFLADAYKIVMKLNMQASLLNVGQQALESLSSTSFIT